MSLPLYIDPGTGSMLFSLFIGIIAAGSFGLRALYLKLKFVFNGGKTEKSEIAKRVPFVIFSDHRRYWNVFKPVCDEFERRGIDAVFYTASADDPALSAGYRHIRAEYLGEGNRPYARLNMLCADILLATTPGLDVYQWKRSRNVKCYVHIPHTADDLAGYRMFGLDYYDAVLTTGRNQDLLIRKIESLRPGIKRKELCTAGSVPLDALKRRLDGRKRRGRQGPPVVLVAPSWGKSGILSRYGAELLSALRGTGFEIIVRPHPQTVVSERDVLEPLEGRFKDIGWNYDNDNFDVLDRADILISDFSGIIFDYVLVFDKPLIYADTDFDTLPYDADWLDEPIWSFRVLPRLGIPLKQGDFPVIGDIIRRAVESNELQAARQEVREECWAHIGESAKNVVEWLVEKEKTLTGGNK